MKKLFASLLFCFVLSAKAVVLEWDPNSESNLAGYRVYTGRQSRVYDTVLDVGNVTLAQLATAPGTTYYAVTAYDEDGLESDFSDEVFYTAPTVVPRYLVYPLSAGRWQIESAIVLGDSKAWVPFAIVTGPIDFQIAIDTGIPTRYFRAQLIP